MSYYNENDKNKVITIRITEAQYKQLSEYVVKAQRKSYWPRKTTSSVSAAMIAYCLNHGIDVFK